MTDKPTEKETAEEEILEQEPVAPSDEITIEELRREAHGYKEKYLRGLADGENARKRLDKDRQEIRKNALRGLVLDILTPIDHLEQALAHSESSSEEVRHWAVGFEMILKQMRDALAGHGINSYSSTGQEFDPYKHEAVETVETAEHEDGTVIEEFLCGYTLGEQILRPARVKVAKAPKKSETEESLGEE